jgi:hypothetical protein
MMFISEGPLRQQQGYATGGDDGLCWAVEEKRLTNASIALIEGSVPSNRLSLALP